MEKQTYISQEVSRKFIYTDVYAIKNLNNSLC